MQFEPKSKPLIGLLVASVIVILWIGTLAFLLSTNLAQLTPLWILPGVLVRTFIQTGLFIVAHDAIHGAVIPGDRPLNQRIGRLALMLYALLSYQKLSINHWQHHQHPGQASDPDFHDGINRNIFAWYLKFMKEYIDARQRTVLFYGMGIFVFTLTLVFHVAIANLLLFWLLPLCLSSMQLFLFGTYLPHRSSNAESSHNATSSNYSRIWSFLTCYHFGYHWEHHEYPALPWYGLPAARQNRSPKQTRPIDLSKPLLFRLATTPLLTLFSLIIY